jgi:hypothetical protein
MPLRGFHLLIHIEIPFAFLAAHMLGYYLIIVLHQARRLGA